MIVREGEEEGRAHLQIIVQPTSRESEERSEAIRGNQRPRVRGATGLSVRMVFQNESVITVGTDQYGHVGSTELTSREKRATALFTPHLQLLAIENFGNVSYMSAKSSPAIIPPGASLGHLYLDSDESARLGRQLAVDHTHSIIPRIARRNVVGSGSAHQIRRSR